MEHKGEPRIGTPLHHQHRAQGVDEGEGPEAMGKDELLTHRQGRRPVTLLQQRLERLHQGVPGCTGMAARRTDGRAVPHDVFSRQPFLPLRHRLGRAEPRPHHSTGPRHLFHVATREKLAPHRHYTRDGGAALLRHGTCLLPLQVFHRQHQGHLQFRIAL